MVSFKSILKLSLPIMIGSAVQNLITLTDTIFLGRVGKIELGAIGLVGVFYLLITTIGYSFTKAGQIMIARRVGSSEKKQVGTITFAMFSVSLLLASVMFLFMKFGGEAFFGSIVKDPDIYKACIAYLDYRAPAVFFSYAGVVIIALYTGVSRTTVIIYNALIMGITNTILNYGLIFGELGMPKMGIAGAALASTLAEILAFSVFIIYMILDKKNKEYRLFKIPKLDIKIIKTQIQLSVPIVLQSAAGVGSWFVFFALIEQLGKTELAISNIIRTAYLLFMIPSWGFSSGINTIVSNLIGRNDLRHVLGAINKTAILCFTVTMGLGMSLVIAPEYVLRIGTDDPVLIQASLKLVWVLLVILALYSVGNIYFNGLVGTGATNHALIIQVSCVVLYMVYIYIVVAHLQAPILFAWMAEFVYWSFTILISVWYLRTGIWYKIKI